MEDRLILSVVPQLLLITLFLPFSLETRFRIHVASKFQSLPVSAYPTLRLQVYVSTLALLLGFWGLNSDCHVCVRISKKIYLLNSSQAELQLEFYFHTEEGKKKKI